MAGGIQNNDQQPLSDINITPFVDVMLVLLIIFMVTAPLLESGIPIQLPKASAKALPKDGEAPVTLNITKDSRIYLNKDELSLASLPGQLKSFFSKRNKKEIFIRADGSLPYSMVAQTMALVKAAGIDKIGLVTLPPEEDQGK